MTTLRAFFGKSSLPHWVPRQHGSTQKNRRRWDAEDERWWHRCDEAPGRRRPQLLNCHMLICIRLRLCLQAPRSCQAAVRKRAAGSQSCGGDGVVGGLDRGGVGWESESSNNGVMKEECWDKRWVEHQRGERVSERKEKKKRRNKITKLCLDKELGSPSQTASNLQRLN